MAPLLQPYSLQKAAVLSLGSIFSRICSSALISSRPPEELEKEAERLAEFLDLYVHGYVANEILGVGVTCLSKLVQLHEKNPVQLGVLRAMAKGIMMKNVQEVSLDKLPLSLWEPFWNNLGKMSGLQIFRTPFSIHVQLSQDKLWAQLPHLHCLQVVRIPRRGCNKTLRLLSQHCPNLTELGVQYSKQVDDLGIRYLSSCTNLQALFLFSTMVSADGLAHLLRTLPSLRDLGQCVFMDKVLERLEQFSCPPKLGLTKMYLRDVSAEGMQTLACLCPQLNHVALCIHEVMPRSFDGLNQMRKLTHLMLLNMDFFLDGVGEMLKTVGPRLKSLHLANINEFNGDALAVIWRNCRGLQNLTLQACQMDESDTENPLEGVPPLPHLHRLSCTSYLSAATQSAVLSRSPSLSHLGLLHPTEPVVIAAAESGVLSHLQEFFAPSNSHLSLRLAWVLLERCPHLCRLGYLEEWERVTPLQLVHFRMHLRNCNWDVQLCSRRLPMAGVEAASFFWLSGPIYGH